MTKMPNDHAGSGVDQPNLKSLSEKLSDAVKFALPKSGPANQPTLGRTGNGTIQRTKD